MVVDLVRFAPGSRTAWHRHSPGHVDGLGCDLRPGADPIANDRRARPGDRATQRRHPQPQRVRRIGRQSLAGDDGDDVGRV